MIAQMPELLSFLNALRARKLYYRLSQHRDDGIMVEVSIPDERWEVEFLADGEVDVEVFASDGTIRDAAALAQMLANHDEASPALPAAMRPAPVEV